MGTNQMGYYLPHELVLIVCVGMNRFSEAREKQYVYEEEEEVLQTVLGTGTVFRFFNRFFGAVFGTDNRPCPHRLFGYFKITNRA